MQQAHNSLANFRAETRKRDFARSHRFEVQIIPPQNLMGDDGKRVPGGQRMATHLTSAGRSANHLSLFVEDAMIPGILLGTRPVRINNLNEQRASAIDFGGDSITFTFLVDATWAAKDFFGDWMRGIISKEPEKLLFQTNIIEA